MDPIQRREEPKPTRNSSGFMRPDAPLPKFMLEREEEKKREARARLDSTLGKVALYDPKGRGGSPGSIRSGGSVLYDYDEDPLRGIKIPSANSSMRAGDWICGSCKRNVFAKNIRCTFCNAKKPKKAQERQWFCEVCETTKARDQFTPVTCKEMDDMDIPPTEDASELPQCDPGKCYVAKLVRKSDERGFGFADQLELKIKYNRDVLVQKSFLEALAPKVGGKDNLIGTRLQMQVEARHELLSALKVCYYQVMCGQCMKEKMPGLYKAQMDPDAMRAEEEPEPKKKSKYAE